jgi:hypothetical protein
MPCDEWPHSSATTRLYASKAASPETVIYIRRNECDLMRHEKIFVSVDVQNRVAFHQDDAFLAIVAVERNFHARIERCVAGDEACGP